MFTYLSLGQVEILRFRPPVRVPLPWEKGVRKPFISLLQKYCIMLTIQTIGGSDEASMFQLCYVKKPLQAPII